MRYTYGERACCKICGQDIEYHGRGAWLDRGGARLCQLVHDEVAGWIRPKRKTRHMPA